MMLRKIFGPKTEDRRLGLPNLLSYYYYYYYFLLLPLDHKVSTECIMALHFINRIDSDSGSLGWGSARRMAVACTQGNTKQKGHLEWNSSP
jgi:hypothetical protein